jgi:ABC-type antimicrobial peptide transport system permease subunit
MFATVALLLTAIGVYGVVSWAVRQTTSEIGISVALGAAPPDVLRHVLVGGLLPVFVGLLVGGLASIAASQLVVGLVVGATGVSASVMVMAAAVLTIIAAIAASLPARRAMMIDPVAALRME